MKIYQSISSAEDFGERSMFIYVHFLRDLVYLVPFVFFCWLKAFLKANDMEGDVDKVIGTFVLKGWTLFGEH